MKTAVIIPCHNEAETIGQTIDDFRSALHDAEIWVCDNNSSDDTAAIAQAHGAQVLNERNRGKGNAVRRLFTSVEADVYVLTDGDRTYDASMAPEMIELLIRERAAMIVGVRKGRIDGQYRKGHLTVNILFNRLFRVLFGPGASDLLSGYRVMSRRFVKTFPARSKAFEIETELTAHAALYRLPTREIETPYKARPAGSVSKLRSYTDGLHILLYFFMFLKDLKPLQTFGIMAFLFFVLSGLLSIPIFATYFSTGLVPKLPTAMVVVGCAVLGFLFTACGIILHTIRHAAEAAFLRDYNSIPDIEPAHMANLSYLAQHNCDDEGADTIRARDSSSSPSRGDVG